MSDTGTDSKVITDLVDEIVGDQEAADYAHAIETSRMRVIGLALNYASIQVISELNNRMPGDIPLPDGLLDTAHESLDNAIVSHTVLLGR